MQDDLQLMSKSEGSSASDFAMVRGGFARDYELSEKVLGTGMSGSVMTGVHKETKQKVAVKCFEIEKLAIWQRMDLNREIEIQSSLEHPNIAKLKGVYKSRQHKRMIVEYLAGGDVFQQLEEQRRLSESETASVIRQALTAVDYMHSKGVVHRDIKLENLVYESGDRDCVKLIDFGLSCFWSPGQAKMTRICGTWSCMAPEVSSQAYTSKADLFSIGACAYSLLTGQELMRAANGSVIFSSSFRTCSVQAQEFITALLETDPELRPDASQALRHSWMQDAKWTSDYGKSTGSAFASAGRSGQSTFSPRSSTHAISALTKVQDPSLKETDVEASADGADVSQPARARRSFFKSDRMSRLWTLVCRRTRTAARVVPDMQIVPTHNA